MYVFLHSILLRQARRFLHGRKLPHLAGIPIEECNVGAMQRTSIFRFRLYLLTLLAGGTLTHGQVADSNLIGTVIDQSNAAVPNALVELVSEDTGVRSWVTTDHEGGYRFGNVLSGLYSVEASAPGFKTTILKSLNLQLNRTQTANLQLEVSSAASSVVVHEFSAELLDTSTPAIQTAFGSRIAAALPLTAGGHGVLNLSLLTAGVASSGGLGYGSGPSVGGQRPTNNNFMIDGVDNNSRASTGPVMIVPNEAVKELALQQNQYSPEFGHSSGGQFNTVVKSGTNEFHGSAFHYLQNRHLNAIDAAFNRQGVSENPRYDQNRFGGTLGGPIRANRIFFFTAVEGQLRGRAATSAGAVYTPTAQGMTELRSITSLSKNNLDAFAHFVPVASVASRNITIQGRTIPVGIPNTLAPVYSNNLRVVSSIDAHLSDIDELRGRWIHNAGKSLEGASTLPVFYTPATISNHLLSLSEFHTFSPSLLNEFRLGVNRSNDDLSAGSFQFPGLDAFPSFQFNDLSLSVGPNAAYPQANRTTVYQVAETVTWMKNLHTLKAGYDARKVNSTFNFVQRQRGEYTYNTLERYLLDLTPEVGIRSVGAMPFIGNQVSHYAFVNDEWRLRANLIISLGLRYEFVAVAEGARRQFLNAISNVPGLLEFRSPEPSRRDFAPRMGIAWSPKNNGRTVLRAGFGLTYDQNYHNLAINSLPPQYSTSVEAHIERPNLPNFLGSGGIPGTAVPITTPAVARSLTGYWIPDQQRPYALTWTAGMQQVMADNYNLEVRYLGTKGVHLPMQTQLNRLAGVASAAAGLPVYLARPTISELDALPLTLDVLRPINSFAQYGFARTITSYAPRGNSSYHGMATQLSKRYKNGLQFLLAHTWSHNIDDSTAVVASTLLTPRRPQDFSDLRSERANSMLDHRHRVSASWVYDFNIGRNYPDKWRSALTRGWTVSGVWIAETGTWATVRSGVDSNLNADPLADRTMVNVAGNPGTSSTVSALTNSAGKTVAYLAKDPTAMYIQAGVGAYPNSSRNTLLLPGIGNFDLSLGKTFRLDEHLRLQFRVESYNAMNRSQFVPGFVSSVDVRPRVTAASNSLLLTGNALFNRPDLAFESNSRQVQLVCRFEF